MDNWQPIETIPMDGTPVLVWLSGPMLGCRIWPARYRPNMKVVGASFAFDLGDRKPTHWRPELPGPIRGENGGQ